MKKVFKKATATVTAAAMLASLTACGGGAASSSTTAAPAADTKAEGGAESTEAAASAIDNKDIKIGVSIWSSTDVLGSQCKLILDEAARFLGYRFSMLIRDTYLRRLPLLLSSWQQQDARVSSSVTHPIPR